MTPHTRPLVCFGAAVAAAFALTTPAWSAAETTTHVCEAPANVTRLDYALARTARRIAAGDPVKIVAIGSSSTAGAGASSPAASYPKRLESYLRERFPREAITVLNRGVNGEEMPEMLARFDASVIAEKPDLVLWQIGSNSVLRDHPVAAASGLIREGVQRLRDAGADVILVNPQFAPKIIFKHDIDAMVQVIDATAKETSVSVFNRFAVMRHWRTDDNMPFDSFLSNDELHMNDWSYACVAKLLAGALTEAATRPTAAAHLAPAAP